MARISVKDAIKFKRGESGLSQRELAARAGLSSAYVSALETGRIQPSLNAFARLAKVLGFTGPELKMIMAGELDEVSEDSGHPGGPEDPSTPTVLRD